ncbi:MAG: hypothetical protein JKY53_04440 [Flavobacteriales bacterium]|nr:hypothetical protein [Flavobacteriales bacterium]
MFRYLALFPSVNIFAQEEMYDICPIKNSEEVPSAVVYEKSGTEIDLKPHIGKRPVVVVFYRGG